MLRRNVLVVVLALAFLTVPFTGCIGKGETDADASVDAGAGGGDAEAGAGAGTGAGSGAADGDASGSARTAPAPPGAPRPSGSSDGSSWDGDGASGTPPGAAGATLTLRHGGEDGMLVMTVADATGELSYRRLVVRLSTGQYTFGAEPSHAAKRFGVDGVTDPDTVVAAGDVIRVPASGDVHVTVLLSPTGRVLAQFTEKVPAGTPPAPEPASPGNGESVDENDTDPSGNLPLSWLPVDHPGPVTYEVQYGLDQAFSAPGGLKGITGTSLPIPLDFLPDAGPTGALVPFHWRVRATDGAGTMGPWSATWTVAKAPAPGDLLPGAVLAALPASALPTPLPAVPVVDFAVGASSERVTLTVLGMTGTLLAQDLAVRVNGEFVRLAADTSRATFTVHPPRDPGFPVAPGDALVVPAVGKDVPVDVIHLPSGRVLKSLKVTVPDATPPAAPLPVSPRAGSAAEGPVRLQWAAVEDLSGVTYDVVVTTDPLFAFEAGIHGAYALTGTSAVTDLAKLPSPPDATSPKKTVWWTVRAVDAAGNASPWAPLVAVSVG